MIYSVVPADMLLTQGDILDDCLIYRAAEDGEIDEFLSRVIVLTQACDLAQNKADLVVVAVVHSAEELVADGTLKPAAVRDQVRLGRVFGWYYLPAAPEPIPIPESIIDLRDLHTVPRSLLEKLAADGKRPARLNPRTANTSPSTSPFRTCGSHCPNSTTPAGDRHFPSFGSVSLTVMVAFMPILSWMDCPPPPLPMSMVPAIV